jgi:hypothetical protein
VETRALLEALQEIEKRAERASESEHVMATYVDAGGLVSALKATDNGIVYGRRGTGKTHALLYLAESRRADGDFCVYVDVDQDLGSTEGIYGDSNLPLAERASRLLVDVLGKIHDELLEEAFQGRGDVAALEGVLDHFGEVLVSEDIEVTTSDSASADQSQGTSAALSLSGQGPGVSVGVGDTAKQQTAEAVEVRSNGSPRLRVHFGQTADLFKKAVNAHPAGRVWLLFDEWSGLPLELQPYLAEMLRRLFFGVPKVTARLGAIPHRSEWRVRTDEGYIGIETGAEIFPLLDLDEFVVFPARSRAEQTERSTSFFRTLLFRHLNSALASRNLEVLDSPEQLVSLLFTQVTALHELVRAAEGVPRDALIIVSRAALRAGENKISTEDVRTAASQVFQTTKAALLNGVPEAQKLLQIITDEVISKKARAFLLRQEHTRHPLIERLIDDRILHVIKRGYSSKDDPGERFDVLQIDFGCYVSFLQTQNAPESLFGGVNDDMALDAFYGSAPAVPEDDYRAIRSSVLDLPRVLQTVSAS